MFLCSSTATHLDDATTCEAIFETLPATEGHVKPRLAMSRTCLRLFRIELFFVDPEPLKHFYSFKCRQHCNPTRRESNTYVEDVEILLE